MLPWLYCMFGFTVWRFLAFVFASIVNDLYFGYNIFMCLAWIVFIIANCYGWTLVYSLYLELADLTKLEDLAHLRVTCVTTLLRLCAYKCIFFTDGHHAVSQRLYRAFDRKLQAYHSSQHNLCCTSALKSLKVLATIHHIIFILLASVAR